MDSDKTEAWIDTLSLTILTIVVGLMLIILVALTINIVKWLLV